MSNEDRKRKQRDRANMPERPITPGYVRKEEEYYKDLRGASLEEVLKTAFDYLLPRVKAEIEEQNATGNIRAFNAFADVRLSSGHKLHITISGEPPTLMELLGGGQG